MSQVCLLHHCERGAAQHTGSGTLRGTQAWAHLHAQCTIRSPRSSSAAFVRAAHVARGRIACVTAAVACTRRVRRPCDEAAHHQRGDGARAHTAPRERMNNPGPTPTTAKATAVTHQNPTHRPPRTHSSDRGSAIQRSPRCSGISLAERRGARHVSLRAFPPRRNMVARGASASHPRAHAHVAAAGCAT